MLLTLYVLAAVSAALGPAIGWYARGRKQATRYEFIDLVDAVEKAKNERNARPDHLDRAFVEGADAVLGQLLMRDDTGEEEMRLAYSASGREESMDPTADVDAKERGQA